MVGPVGLSRCRSTPPGNPAVPNLRKGETSVSPTPFPSKSHLALSKHPRPYGRGFTFKIQASLVLRPPGPDARYTF